MGHRRLTDAERQEIIAAVAMGMPKKEVARQYGVADTTVRRLCRVMPEYAQLVAQKRDSIAADVLEGMERMGDEILAVIREGTARIRSQIGDGSLRDVGTVVGIYMDKALRLAEARGKLPQSAGDGDGGVIVLADVSEEPEA